MTRAREPFQLPPEKREEIEQRWRAAIPYFKERSPVVFLSYCRFWETHAFVQQSLARELVAAGVDVEWIDGAGWRPYRPTLYWQSPRLGVGQMFELPGRRIAAVDALSTRLQGAFLKRKLARGARPLFWVQAGMDERLVRAVPYVDVFSVFDDPHRYAPEGPLCAKARLVVCQNSFTRELLSPLGEKAKFMLPPVDMESHVFAGGDGEPIEVPAGFPSRVMGYIGSFFPEGFDFELLERCLTAIPDWGFLLMGRTDAEGEARIDAFKKHPNFLRLAWQPRHRIASVWRRLDVSLLLYRPAREQDGAFATKALESVHFGVPVLSTIVPKTDDIEPYVSRATFGSPDEVRRHAEAALTISEEQLRAAFTHFACEMHPQLHLARVAEFLRARD